jgi:hypothetical protein
MQLIYAWTRQSVRNKAVCLAEQFHTIKTGHLIAGKAVLIPILDTVL